MLAGFCCSPVTADRGQIWASVSSGRRTISGDNKNIMIEKGEKIEEDKIVLMTHNPELLFLLFLGQKMKKKNLNFVTSI